MFNKSIIFFRDLFLPKTLKVTYDSGQSDRPLLIMLHGIAATSKTFDALVNEIDKNMFRIITIDLLGFGKSPKPTNCKYSVDDHVKYVHKTIRKIGIDKKFSIVGHSMGSIIASHYASVYSDEVEQLFLMSLPLYIKDKNLLNIISQGHTDLFLNIYDYVSKNKSLTINSSKNLRKLLGIGDGMEVTDETWDSFRLSLRNTIINQNTYLDISSLRIPVNIIYGALDQLIVQENINKLSKFENIKITKIDFVDHFLSEKFAKVVAAQISTMGTK